MADIRGIQYPGAPNLLGAIQTGANIRGAVDNRALAREKYGRELEQLATENKRVEEDRATKASEQDYNAGARRVQIGKSYNDVGMMEEGFRKSMTALGMDVPEDFPIDQQTYDRFIKVTNEKNPDLQNDMEDQFAKDIGTSIGAFAQKAKGVGADVSAFETGQALEGTVATEQRKIAGQQQLETFKTDEQIREDKARITETTAALKTRPSKGKTQTYSGQSGLYEKGAGGKWKLTVADPKTTNKKVVDQELRELNLTEKISKQVTREANNRFGKLVPQREFSDARGKFIENTEYDFEGRSAFVDQRIEELRTKAGISDEVIRSLREGVSSHDPAAAPDIPGTTTAGPPSPQAVPQNVADEFAVEGLADQGFILGEIETDGKLKGQYQVLDQAGNIKGHFAP